MQTSGLKVKILDRFSPKVCISRCVIRLLHLVGNGSVHANSLLGLPHGFGVLVLWNIVKVAGIILYPTAKDTEGIGVHSLTCLFLPFLGIAHTVTETLGVVQVNAESDLFPFIGNGKGLAVLQAVKLC